jgi:hypothetical protein
MSSKKTALSLDSRGFEATAQRPLTDLKPAVNEL